MAKVRNREDALLDAYLGRYKGAQASTVSEGQSKTKSAQQKGSALLNAADKTLPALKNTYSDTLQNIVSGASMENSLNNDVMQRSMNLAKAKFDAANDLYEQQKKAQEYAEKQAAKAAAAAAKRSGKKSRGSSSKSSTTSAADDTAAADALNKLGIGSENGSTSTSKANNKKQVVSGKSSAKEQAARNASARAKYDGSKQEQKDIQYRANVRNQKTKRLLQEKIAAANSGANKGKAAGNSYAERQNTTQVAQSRAVTSAGKQVGSSYAAAGQAPTERERAAGQQIKKQTADTLKKLQTDKDYLAELAKPGRKLTQSEIDAVKQYKPASKKADLLKQAQNGKISWTEQAKETADLDNLRQKALLNGFGQSAETFTAGFYNSFPGANSLADKAANAIMTDADKQHELIRGRTAADTLNKTAEQDALAAAAGTMAGKSAQYAYFNNLMAGTPLADTMGKVGSKAMSAASKIPVWGRFATPAAGEALGRILTDQTADTVLDTIPSLANDLAAYNDQQTRIQNGEQVDDALTPGRIGLNVLGNVGQNFAMNALPEIGGAVVNGIKNSRTARQMLAEQAQGIESGLNAEDAKGLVDAYKGMQSGDLTTHNVDALNDSVTAYNDWESYAPTLENLPTMGNQAQIGNIDGWQETPDIFLQRLVDETAQTAYDPWGNSYNPNVLNRVDNAPAADVQSVPALERQTAQSVSEAVPTLEQRPLNGSESVPENAVGAQSTQYDRREVLNQDYANQSRFNDGLDADEVQRLGADQNTHTLYSRKESADNARLSFDTYRQSSDGSISAATDNVLKDLRNLDKWNADDLALAKEAQNQQRNLLLTLEKGSPEYEVEFAKYKQLDRQTSRGFSEAGRALQEGVNAEQTADTGLRKFNQLTQKITSEYADSRKGKQLREISDVVYDGKVDEFLTQIAKEQGVEEAMLQAEKQIRKAAESKHIKLNDDEIKKAAASMVAGGNADDMFDALARTQLKIGDFTEADNDRIREIFTQTSGMKDSKARYQLESEAYGIMSKYLPGKSFWDKWNNLRYLSMLGNTRTHARNILGNVSMNAVVRTKDNVSAVMQLAIPQEERTKAIGITFTKQGRELIDGAKKYIDTDAYSLLYNDGKYNVQTGLASAQKTYGNTPFGKLLQWASDKNSGLLEKEDAFFLREAYANSLASFLKARGYDASVFRADDAASKEILRKASAQALEDAKEATFHEDNILSTALKNFSKDTNKSGVAGKLAYAITEGILPFKKTPINIAKNALEYSGGGLVEAGYRAIKGESKARVIDAAAKGITGLGAIGIGYALAKTGILNGGGSGDDRVDAYNEMTGRQDYSVTLPNGATYTIDWTSPAAIPLMIGAELSEDNSGLTVAGFFEKLSRFTNPILETTMLQGLNDTLQNLKYSDNPIWDLGANSVSSYFGQSVPTLLGQISRTMDDTRRSTYGGGQTKPERDNSYALNKMASRIPGLSQSLEPYVDQWGREEASLDGTDDTAGGMFLRGLYNMGSPGYYSSENITPVDEYLQGLYSDTNNSKVLPEKASSKLTLDKETYYMTPEEKTEYAKTTGQTAYDLVDSLRQNDMFLRLPDDQQAELVQDAYTVAKTAGGVAAVGDGVSGVDSKAYQAYADGGIDGAVNYILAKNAVDTASDSSDDSSLKDVEKWNTIQSQMGNSGIDQYVPMTRDDSVVRRIYDNAGSNTAAAYMNAYSAASAGLGEDETPSKYDVGIGMMRQGVRGDDLARAYISAYQKTDKAGTALYGQYGADGLEGWIMYKTAAYNVDKSGNNNGKIDKDEAIATLNAMDLTDELRRAYLTKTNKSWKNPY
jgi:hypothetical protein